MDRLHALPNFTSVPLSTAIARYAAVIAARHRLRGADAVYVTVARRYGAILVTLDREQLERTRGLVESQRPSEALAAL